MGLTPGAIAILTIGPETSGTIQIGTCTVWNMSAQQFAIADSLGRATFAYSVPLPAFGFLPDPCCGPPNCTYDFVVWQHQILQVDGASDLILMEGR